MHLLHFISPTPSYAQRKMKRMLSELDTNQLDKQMTKDTTNSSQLGQSSRHTKQSLPNLRRASVDGEPDYQLFFPSSPLTKQVK